VPKGLVKGGGKKKPLGEQGEGKGGNENLQSRLILKKKEIGTRNEKCLWKKKKMTCKNRKGQPTRAMELGG